MSTKVEVTPRSTYVYPFVEKPQEFETLKSAPIYKVMEKLLNGGKLTEGTDDGWDHFTHKDENGEHIQRPGYDKSLNDYTLFSEIGHSEAYKNGIYRIGGWIFDFRAFFKVYLVKTKYYGWQEQYAPNKTFIRKCAATPSHILKIIEPNED